MNLLTVTELDVAAVLLYEIVPPTPLIPWPLFLERAGAEVSEVRKPDGGSVQNSRPFCLGGPCTGRSGGHRFCRAPLQEREAMRNRRWAVILSGGNVDIETFADVLTGPISFRMTQ